jgi:hypothetical protein
MRESLAAFTSEAVAPRAFAGSSCCRLRVKARDARARRRSRRSVGLDSELGASAQALQNSLFEGIQDGHVEVREITFVASGHGEAMNARRGGDHSVLTWGIGTVVH